MAIYDNNANNDIHLDVEADGIRHINAGLWSSCLHVARANPRHRKPRPVGSGGSRGSDSTAWLASAIIVGLFFGPS